MEDIRRELSKAYEQAARYRRTVTLRQKLRSEAGALEQRLDVLKTAVTEESADVDKLETGSVSGVFYKLLGTFEKHLEKERAERLAAKLKYDETEKALKELRSRISAMEREHALLEGCEAKYAELYAQKTKLLLNSGGEAARRIAALIEEISRIKANLRETGEALDAGQHAAQWLQTAYDHLDDAEGWGTYDLLGGGMIASAVKHDHIDDAADAARQAQLALDRFNAELADIRIASLAGVEMGEGMRFADTFFDGLIVDWMAQRGIEQSLDSVARTKAGVETALMRLNGMRAAGEARLHALEDELHALIMKA